MVMAMEATATTMAATTTDDYDAADDDDAAATAIGDDDDDDGDNRNNNGGGTEVYTGQDIHKPGGGLIATGIATRVCAHIAHLGATGRLQPNAPGMVRGHATGARPPHTWASALLGQHIPLAIPDRSAHCYRYLNISERRHWHGRAHRSMQTRCRHGHLPAGGVVVGPAAAWSELHRRCHRGSVP